MRSDPVRERRVLLDAVGGQFSRRTFLNTAVAVGLGASFAVQLADGVNAAGEGGVIYAVQPDGRLLWYRHEGRDTGASRWTSGTGTEVGSGWGNFKQVFAG